jgi:hypothetical protein
MDDLRNEIYDVVRTIASHKDAEWVRDRLLAAGWTKRGDERKTAWLIEWPAKEDSPARWWHNVRGWTNNAHRAQWFCRHDDAQASIDQGYFIKGVKPVEHIFLISPSTQQPPSEGVPESEDAEGVAERQVGRYVYRRISKLMDAAPGTPEGAELLFLANIASQVEEYGEQACGDHDLSAPAPPVQEQALRDLILNAFRAGCRWSDDNRDAFGPALWGDAEDYCARTLTALRTQGGE